MGVKTVIVSMTAREAAGAIDSAIKQLDAMRRQAERKASILDVLTDELSDILGKPRANITNLHEAVNDKQKNIEELRNKVTAEQSHVSELHRLQAELVEKSEQLKALATLALKHLGEKCPVCDQEYDVDATRRRLERAAMTGRIPMNSYQETEILKGLLQTLTHEEKELTSAEHSLRTAEQANRSREAAENAIEKQMKELGILWDTSMDRKEALEAEKKKTGQQIEEFIAVQKTGEAFALYLSQVGDQSTINELQHEIEIVRAKLQEEQNEITMRIESGEEAQRVIEALREATSRVVTDRVKEIEPLLSDIYSRIDVHPAFKAVRFLTSVVRGRGLLSAIVSDPTTEVECDTPATVLSSSQMNALAVCMFLSLNLGLSASPLEAAILDDPLQSLDDINLLGLIDLLRQTKDKRQLFVSTHDIRFGNLLARKLRPSSEEQRTLVIELDNWSRVGPFVSVRDIHCDPVPLRLVGASTG